MDRSFLSDDLIIEASREFVCIRLTTYENKSEHDFMQSLYRRSNQTIANTTFAILSPDTNKIFSGPARSPQILFNNSFHMAASMHEVGHKFKPKSTLASAAILPAAASVKIGLNIAASDKLPLILAVGADKSNHQELESKLNKIVWDDAIVGKCTFASTHQPKDLGAIKGTDKKTNVFLVIEPGEFGTKGKVLSVVDGDLETDKLVEKISDGLAMYTAPRTVDHRTHTQNGIRAGVFYETPLPVTDKMEAQARSRTKQRIERRK